MVERRNGIAEVRGSNPLLSISFFSTKGATTNQPRLTPLASNGGMRVYPPFQLTATSTMPALMSSTPAQSCGVIFSRKKMPAAARSRMRVMASKG